MSSVLDDINKKRTRQSVGEQPAAAPVEPVAPAAPVTPQTVQHRPSEEVAPAQTQVAPAAPATGESQAPKQMTYTDLHKELYKPMTPEEQKAQQKRQRNRQIINAVGDGISALANLYYTNRSGVNAYDPSTSLTKAAKERYDKLLAQQREDEERYKAMAYQAGAADIEMAYRRAKDAAAEKRADKAADDAAEARRLAQENWQKTFDYNKEQDAAKAEAAAKKAAEDNATRKEIAVIYAQARKEIAQGKLTEETKNAIKGMYGKRTVHGVDGYPIYDRVWNGGWGEVFDFLVQQQAGKGNDGDYMYKRKIAEMTQPERQKFVETYYKDYPEAEAMMKTMAMDTPEKQIEQITAGDDDYSQYAVGGDDYSQYIVE